MTEFPSKTVGGVETIICLEIKETNLFAGGWSQSQFGDKFQKGVVLHGVVGNVRERDYRDGLLIAFSIFTILEGFTQTLDQPG